MTALLVLATFAVFATVDWLLTRHRAAVPGTVKAAQPAPRPPRLASIPDVVAGFGLPANLRYHPGHSWALLEGKRLVRMGLDDFAARLVGKATRIRLPQRDRWVRQGQKIWTIERDGAKVDMVSPVEGAVVDVNEAVMENPQAALRDPYGEGWLVTVMCPDVELNLRNLLSGALARRWMEEASQRLLGKMPRLAGAFAQDGGLAVSDLGAHLPDAEWAELARSFFLA